MVSALVTPEMPPSWLSSLASMEIAAPPADPIPSTEDWSVVIVAGMSVVVSVSIASIEACVAVKRFTPLAPVIMSRSACAVAMSAGISVVVSVSIASILAWVAVRRLTPEAPVIISRSA